MTPRLRGESRYLTRGTAMGICGGIVSLGATGALVATRADLSAYAAWRASTGFRESDGGRVGQLVRENVGIVVPQQIQPCAGRQEGEAGLGQVEPVFPHQQCLQPSPQRMQVQHVGGGVGALLGG